MSTEGNMDPLYKKETGSPGDFWYVQLPKWIAKLMGLLYPSVTGGCLDPLCWTKTERLHLIPLMMLHIHGCDAESRSVEQQISLEENLGRVRRFWIAQKKLPLLLDSPTFSTQLPQAPCFHRDQCHCHGYWAFVIAEMEIWSSRGNLAPE